MKNLTKMTLISLATLTALSMGAWAECSADVDMGGHKVTTSATEFADNELVSKAYVMGLINTALADNASHIYIRDMYLPIVTDYGTGLTWQDSKDSDDSTKLLSWDSAKSYCSNLGLADVNDWRLPTLSELKGVVKQDNDTPKISSIFHNKNGSFYWSSTPNNDSDAWGVLFYSGNQAVHDKGGSYYVRCVRGGE